MRVEDAKLRWSGLPAPLVNHLEGVSRGARALAERWDVDPDDAALAGYLHDVARARSPEVLLKQAREYAVAVHPVEEAFPVLLHGAVGAAEVAKEWPELDEGFLAAISYHSTGRGEMSALEKVVVLADKLEPRGGPPEPFFEELNELAFRDLDKAVLRFLEWQVRHLLDRGNLVHPASIDAWNRLVMARGATPLRDDKALRALRVRSE